MCSFLYFLILNLLELCRADNCPNMSFYPKIIGDVTLENEKEFSVRETNAEVISFYGFGDLGFYNSLELDIHKQKKDLNIISSIMTSCYQTPPTIAYAYFNSEKNYKPNNSTYIQKYKDATIPSNYGLFTDTTSILFKSIIEYQDIDNDHIYTPDKDIIVQKIGLDKQLWDNICYNTLSNKANLNIFRIKTKNSSLPIPHTYVDFSLEAQYSSTVGISSEHKIITPKSIKLSVDINNFPYMKNDTYICLEVIIASASTSNNIQYKKTPNNLINIMSNNKMYFMWDDIDSNNIKITSSQLYDSSISELTGISSKIYFTGNPTANITVKKIYYTFDKKNTEQILWDPIIGFGNPPKKETYDKYTTMIILSSVIGGIILITIIYYCCKKCKNDDIPQYSEIDYEELLRQEQTL